MSADPWKIKAYAVVGANSGDEGKGLMVDYLCKRHRNDVILNIKTNGGSQAGHTACEIRYNGVYRHWVFNTLGAGTLTGAHTYLPKEFILNIERLYMEKDNLEKIYGVKARVIIDINCQVALPVDWMINTFMEDSREHRHGSCGLGIYETFNRVNIGYGLRVKDIMGCQNKEDLKKIAYERAEQYMQARRESMYTELNSGDNRVDNEDIEHLFDEIRVDMKRWVAEVDRLMGWIYGCERPQWTTMYRNEVGGIKV